MRRLRSALAAFAALSVLTLSPASVVYAHSEVLGTSPASGATVGGDIERIDIVLGDTVANAVMIVTGPEGPVAGEMVQADGLVIALGLDDKIETEGQYKVEFEFDSINDEDFVELEFAFNYEEGAPDPLPVVAGAGKQDSSASTIAIGLLAASTVVLAGLLAWRYRKLAAMRARNESPEAQAR